MSEAAPDDGSAAGKAALPAGERRGREPLGRWEGPAMSLVAPALLLLSAGGLLLEIALTRVLSVLYFSTFSYLVLSLAILGLAGGAALATLFPATRRQDAWGLWASLCSLAGLAVTYLAVAGAATPARVLLFPLTALPYLFLGIALAGIFASRSSASPRLYLADLAGAGLGALSAVPLLDALGGIGGMLAAATAPALGAVLLALAAVRSYPVVLSAAGVAVAAATGLLALQLSGAGPTIDMSRIHTPKPLRQALQAGGVSLDTRWDAFARSDLVYLPGRDRYLIYLDGGAASLVPDASSPQSWLTDVGALAFAVASPERVFLIGPGGGLDIALARSFGVERIVAAEVNRGAVELTRSLTGHAGDLYGPGTRLAIDDGRSALHRSAGEFDLILLSQVVTQAAEARGMALVENGLYTVEAFAEYLDRLTPDGLLALKLYDELTLTRALLTAINALGERGVGEADAARHLFAVLDARADQPVPLLLVRASPLSRDEAVGWARLAEERGLALLFVPGLLAPPILGDLLEGTAGVSAIVEGAGEVDLRPTRDDRPFFYGFERGLPRPLRPLTLAVTGLLALTLVLAWWLRRSSQAERRLAPALFAAIGAGFMLVEITVLQRTQLLIGHPALALTSVLSTLLLGAALGSGLADRTGQGREYRWVALASGASALLALVWLALWPALSTALQAASPVAAAVGAALATLPLALPMGAPFPLALRSVGRWGDAEVALAWTVNGVASVAGAVAATALAIVYGFTAAGTVAAAGYALAAALAWRLSRAR